LENSGLPHEIGSHSFSHIIFSSNECTPELAQWEFQKAYQLGQSFPSPCTSFVFPRNQCRYLNELYTSGFRSYRGEDPAWFNTLPLGKWGKKIGHILDLLWIQTPPCSLPLLEPSGLLNLQGSMNYLSMAGWRRYIPLKCRVQQAKKGILSAIRSKTLFHLWFHPSHLGEEEDLLFQGLDSIFAEVAQAREAGKLDVFTMGSLFLTLSHCYSFLKKL
jgi:hypothetical protein